MQDNYISKKLSCGVILVNELGEVLMIHATRQTFWDIPKGTKKLEETESQAALRELKEETGIVLTDADLTDLSWHHYNMYKDLWLFAAKMPKVEMDELKCSSTFIHESVEYPEADDFQMIPLKSMPSFACNSMSKLLHDSLISDIERFYQKEFGA